MAVCLTRRVLLSSILILVALNSIALSAFAEGFRIETKIYVGDEKKEKQAPASQTTTLFLNGVVYDFLSNPDQTAVFRKPGGGKPGQFTLLNDGHIVQTKLSTEQLAATMNKLRSWAAGHADPFLQFAANPNFTESFDRDSGKLVLASHLESYTLNTTEVDRPEALAEYKEFLDWYTQLNTLVSASKLPPEPRLRLNAALARHHVVPQTVELTRAGEDPIRAEHTFTWRVSQDDQKRIDQVRAALTSYREVNNEEFRRMTMPKKPAR